MKRYLGEILFVLLLFTTFGFFAFADGFNLAPQTTNLPAGLPARSNSAASKLETNPNNSRPLLITTRFDW